MTNPNYNFPKNFTMAQLPPEALGMNSYVENQPNPNQNAFSLPPEVVGLSPLDGVTPIEGVSDYDIVQKTKQLRSSIDNLN
jgi:hypothetical protein